MANLNKVLLVGNLTRDPEGRELNGGNTVCSCGLGVNRKYKQGDEWKTEATFVDFDAWGTQATFLINYCRKGSCVMIEGRLQMDSWQDRNTGQQRSKLKVVAERVQSLDRRQDSQQSQQQQPPRQAPPQQQPVQPPPPPFPVDAGDESIDDIPF